MKNVSFILLGILFFYSCKKNANNGINEEHSDYLPMNVGNYWVYQEFYGTNQSQLLDSVFISKDTLINGITYFKFEKLQLGSESHVYSFDFYRDSAKYLVNSKGVIFFSETNFLDTLTRKMEVYGGDTLYHSSYKMERIQESITTQVGTFDQVLDFRGTIFATHNSENSKNPKYNNHYYAKGVGKIFYSAVYLISDIWIEYHLVRYKIIK